MTIMLAESRIPHEECERPLPVRSHVLAAELPRKPPVASRERVLVVNPLLFRQPLSCAASKNIPYFGQSGERWLQAVFEGCPWECPSRVKPANGTRHRRRIRIHAELN